MSNIQCAFCGTNFPYGATVCPSCWANVKYGSPTWVNFITGVSLLFAIIVSVGVEWGWWGWLLFFVLMVPASLLESKYQSHYTFYR